MKHKIFIPVLTLTLLFMSGCTKKDHSENAALTKVPFKDGEISKIFIEKVQPEVKEINLSELITDFRVIPLETKEECLLSNTWLTFSNDFILVGTQNFPNPARLYRFDHEGYFIDEIGGPGKGPGEHAGYAVEAIKAYENDHTILVNWNGVKDDPQLFDYDGSFMGEVEQPYQFLDIHRWSDALWFSTGAFADYPRNRKDSMVLVFYDQEGNIAKEIPRTNYPPVSRKTFSPSVRQPSLYQYNDQWRLYMDGNDTVFTIENMSLSPAAVLVPGDKMLPFNETISPNQLTGRYSLDVMVETKNNWFIKKNIIKEADLKQFRPGQWGGRYDTKNEMIVVDKQSQKAATMKLKDDIFYLFPNKAFTMGFEWKNNHLFFGFPPISLKELMKEASLDSIQNPKAKRIMDQIREMPDGDNPVIFSFTLKDRVKI